MKNKKNLLPTVFLILAVIFIIYGIYAIMYSIDYLHTYTTSTSTTLTGTVQYVATSSLAYFGFGFCLLGISFILKKLNDICDDAGNQNLVKPVAEASELEIAKTESVEPEIEIAAPEITKDYVAAPEANDTEVEDSSRAPATEAHNAPAASVPIDDDVLAEIDADIHKTSDSIRDILESK